MNKKNFRKRRNDDFENYWKKILFTTHKYITMIATIFG